MFWRVITYRLPAERSLHRIAIWRGLRRLGAVPLQQGSWALPVGEPFDAELAQITDAITVADGYPLMLAVVGDQASVGQLEARFTAQREAEWAEFTADCGKYEAELDGKVAKGRLALVELDKEEQSLERLRRWSRAIRARGLLGALGAADAERRLKECTEALEQFAELVYQASEHGGAG